MDITRKPSDASDTYSIDGSYDEMLTIAKMFKPFDPRARDFYVAANLATTHVETTARVTDLTRKRVETVASRLENRNTDSHPIACAVRDSLNVPDFIYMPEL